MTTRQTELETADPRDVVDVDSIDMAEDGRIVYMWLRLADGRAALWEAEQDFQAEAEAFAASRPVDYHAIAGRA